jgi:hypothetical protein
MDIQTRINNSLEALYNTDDPIYKSLICDKDGVVPGTITVPTDIDIGAIASQIEWLRLLSIDLAAQLFIDQASDEFLEYALVDFFNCLRVTGESDADWIARSIAIVFAPRVSKAAIISLLSPYSTSTPTIQNGKVDAGYADCCFSDVYDSFTTTDPVTGDDIFVFGALSGEFGSTFFAIQITMYGFTGNLQNIVNIVNSSIAAGITYTFIFE